MVISGKPDGYSIFRSSPDSNTTFERVPDPSTGGPRGEGLIFTCLELDQAAAKY
jgi:hypothetical protein